METRRLGRTDMHVTKICLGTMTWGEQNTEAEGHEQMDYSVEQGINCFDTAEMYAVPPKPETQGRTEEIIGTWFASRPGMREKIILMTKVAGPAPGLSWIRDGRTALTRENMMEALDTSLKRLQTDHIDLYQIHWPKRKNNRFGKLDYPYDPAEVVEDVHTELEVLDEMVKSGKVRAVGLSNESPWGISRFLFNAETRGLVRVASTQNVYNLLNRSYEIGLSEMSLREDVGLLAYSPLARGFLSGKYLDGQIPAGSFMALDPRGSRYANPRCEAAIKAYKAVADKRGMRLDQMSIAFVTQQPFVTTNIIGATSMEQLKLDIATADMLLDEDTVDAINKIHLENPNPGP